MAITGLPSPIHGRSGFLSEFLAVDSNMILKCLFTTHFTPAKSVLLCTLSNFSFMFVISFFLLLSHSCWFLFHFCLSSCFLDKRLFCSQLSSNSWQRFSGAIPLPDCFFCFYHSIFARCWLPFENSHLKKIHIPRERLLCPSI